MMLCNADFDELFPAAKTIAHNGLDRWEDDGGRVPPRPVDRLPYLFLANALTPAVILSSLPMTALWFRAALG